MYRIRPILPSDNNALAHLITAVLKDYGAVGEGYACNDPEIWDMYGTFTARGFGYWVVADDKDRALGGGGFGLLRNGPPGVCEIQKMYFDVAVRGYGFGKKIIDLALAGAQAAGYQYVYLETLPHMHEAQALYISRGFQMLESPMGNTGHHKCPIWMGKELP
jgi:putative acetyltransferase